MIVSRRPQERSHLVHLDILLFLEPQLDQLRADGEACVPSEPDEREGTPRESPKRGALPP